MAVGHVIQKYVACPQENAPALLPGDADVQGSMPELSSSSVVGQLPGDTRSHSGAAGQAHQQVGVEVV